MGKLQTDIFGDLVPYVPITEGIKYAGSKLKLLPYISQIMGELPDIHDVLDGFSGTTRVSQAFSQMGYNTTACDISVWSETFGQCYLMSTEPDHHYQQIIDHLNSLKGYDGWYTQNYGGEINETKKPFQAKNTRKLDAIRDQIETLNLPTTHKAVVLTSLIQALDSVDSTMGHYVSYLNHWSPRSHNDLLLKLPKRHKITTQNRVVRDDIFSLTSQNQYDLAYFDPPYGSNNEKMPPSRVRYASYYHIWKTVIENDHPQLFGKAARREDCRDGVSSSIFEEFRRDEQGRFTAMQALRELIQNTNARYIMLSYSSGGRATKEELTEIINSNGRLLKAIEIDYKKNVMGSMRWTNQWINSDGKHYEYLFLMEK